MMNDDVRVVRGVGVSQVWRREAWGRIVRAWHESGMPAAAFAEQHGLRDKSLFRWQKKLRLAPKPACVGVVEEVTRRPAAAAAFDEVLPVPSTTAPALELHAGELRVLVHGHCDPDLLRNLIHILQERPC
jgi:hypothetical protein